MGVCRLLSRSLLVATLYQEAARLNAITEIGAILTHFVSWKVKFVWYKIASHLVVLTPYLLKLYLKLVRELVPSNSSSIPT